MGYIENGMENPNIVAEGVGRGQGQHIPMRAPAMAPSVSSQAPFQQFNNFPASVPFNANHSAQVNNLGFSNIGGGPSRCCGNCGASGPAVAPVNPPRHVPVPPVNSNINVPPMPPSNNFGVSGGSIQPSVVSISHPNQGMMGACPVARNFRNDALAYPGEPIEPMRFPFPPIHQLAPSGPGSLNSMLPAFPGSDVNPGGHFGRYPPPRHPVAAANNVPQLPYRVGQEFPNPPPPNVSYGPHSMVPPMPFNAPLLGAAPPMPSRAPFPPLVGPPAAPKASDDDLAAQLGFLSINPAPESAKSSAISSRYLQETFNELHNLASQISPETKPFDTAAMIIAHAVRKYNLAHPTQWRLSIRTHSCTAQP